MIPYPTSHFVDESSVFGRLKEKEEVIELLLSNDDEDKNVSVVCIVGKGGIGKTTLAQLVYNDRRCYRRFEACGWIYVSQDFDIRRLTKSLIESVGGDSSTLTELSNLQQKLKEEILGKTLFLVFDNVWNEQQTLWELLCAPFKYAEKVRILVTTRNNRVAQNVQTAPSFHLGYLPEKECLNLFQHHAFSHANEEEKTRDLMEIGRQITIKCGGLPLAVKSLASLLKYERDESNWGRILESAFWELHENSEIFAALKISYKCLPANLKPCFLFCSMFPKKYHFEREWLVHMWIAQGYVKSKYKKNAEEMGNEYVDELVQRSFLDHNAPGFEMHDVIHDLAQLISEGEHYALENIDLSDLSHEVCHLYLKGSMSIIEPLNLNSHAKKKLVNLASLRTLVVHLNNGKFQEVDLTPAKSLRIFELQGKGSEMDIQISLGKLKHLRYLKFIFCGCKRLPESICFLYNLQTLILVDCFNILELPEQVGNLLNLRYLCIRGTKICRVPESICFLTNLESLNLTACEINELPDKLGELHNLKDLVLSDVRIENLPSSIGQLSSLQKLILDFDSLKRFPSTDLGNLTNLQILYVNNSLNLPVPVGIHKLTALQRLSASLCVSRDEFDSTIGLLKDLVNLKGSISLFGLGNMFSLADAQLANIGNKNKIEELTLSWPTNPAETRRTTNGLILSVTESYTDNLTNKDMDLLLLKCLQPHRNIKRLHISGYSGIKFPRWMSEPSSCACIETISVERCHDLRSLSFSNFHNLKSLTIIRCQGLELLTRESLPMHLQVLCVKHCLQLKCLTLPQYMQSSKLVELHVERCPYLESLVGIGNLCALKSLTLVQCPRLLNHDMLAFVPPNVNIYSCAGLEQWCQRQSINYYAGEILSQTNVMVNLLIRVFFLLIDFGQELLLYI